MHDALYIAFQTVSVCKAGLMCSGEICAVLKNMNKTKELTFDVLLARGEGLCFEGNAGSLRSNTSKFAFVMLVPGFRWSLVIFRS